jgi:hypothetical protein
MVAVAIGAAVVGSVASGAIKSSAAKGAAKTQAAAADKANAAVEARYQQTRADLAPYREAGLPSLGRLNSMLTDGYEFKPTDPSYDFRFGEGNRAVNTSASAQGNRLSGGTLKALTRYGQGMASTEYGNQFNRNLSLAGIGQSSAAQTGTFGANAAAQSAELTTQAGNAIAGGQIGAGNAWGGAVSSIGNLGVQSMMGGFGGGSSGYSPAGPNVGGLSQFNQMPGLGWSGGGRLPSGGGGY